NLKVEMEIKVTPEELETLYESVNKNHQIQSLERLKINFGYQSSLNISYITKVEMFHGGGFQNFYLAKSTSSYEITTVHGGKVTNHGTT
ncbi:hypothetical protein R0K19_24195, partial [Bacillus sp. SIMBA_161]